jgi:hypothetical protein
MRHWFPPLIQAVVLSCLATIFPTTVNAQGGGPTSSIAGTVVDPSGAVLPGASITTKNNATEDRGPE